MWAPMKELPTLKQPQSLQAMEKMTWRWSGHMGSRHIMACGRAMPAALEKL